jgi:predicted short-subunit dehydrogenase-like oxidoreductase (DUF2520 family)
MEYGEAISSRSADRAFDIACRKLAGREDLRRVATEAVAEAYCVCVVDGEDAAEGQLSAIHLNLVDQLVIRLERSTAEEAR